MGSKSRQLHIFFFPLMAPGHMLPIIDTARLITTQGVKATIITTPLNESFVSKTIERTKTCSGFNIDIKTIKFPTVEVGLPKGCENIDSLTSVENSASFLTATRMLRQPLEQLLQDYRPHCIVADMFFPWATDVAAKFGIPRLVFHVTSFFSLSTMASLQVYEPHKKVLSDSEPFVIPNFPDEIKLTRMKMAHQFNEKEGVLETEFTKVLKEANEADVRSYGVIVNSFYELEPAYANHYIKVLGRKAWHIGPVSLCNKEDEDKVQRGKESSIDKHECLNWLNAKNSDSVVYICFGSLANLTDSQLMEIAMGLEASEQQFIWVVKKGKDEKEEEDWLAKGFEKRMEGKGLIIRGWAPQVLILDHEAIGGFVTHCGWNSTLEGVIAGVPMVTWPMFAEQFYNEKLVTEVLKIGVPVGADKQFVNMMANDAYIIKKEAIENAVRRIIMVSEEAKEMRSRAKALGEMARRAMEKGGSSYFNLNALIEELKILSG
ncbi:scopoletin glucosyltransferase-like isoform X2 [Juglans microcarpa x Juglans regia]|uniref:scopoletin glucosyltransferase-like isoform X1 n=1 Tax=Juglans microcarpa x Juglans regia TaxID=2249226 RepID=UPI001B7E579C|nr:scopoletin glucosyltransferase-like isoform X1 [Juglans microcarpa x Juglans regia]XP_041013587.1 scopoletin glucosyltransferase-like isoform X2 [Juglans microcarpa x Juglans regia]